MDSLIVFYEKIRYTNNNDDTKFPDCGTIRSILFSIADFYIL